ncbi:DUF2971 domain-containing protein [Lysobacter korlensis]|uniref:DUF2971 domain-containing protein n=1 Tax=Lysobacter korlensis TaxID=553636 RepID=A0ABV6RWW4_9GAMM
MLTDGRLPYVDSLLTEEPPKHLFHYTGGAGLIGILDSKQMWAGRAADLNDATEQKYAPEQARVYIAGILESASNLDPRVAAQLERMRDSVHFTNRQVYTVSLSAERDVLSQWRAYCPRSGGVALGLPAHHLRSVANVQGFFLARCLYDGASQWRLIRELVDHHLESFVRQIERDPSREAEEGERCAVSLAADLAQYGPLLKHPTFKEEFEWRLVSRPSHVGDARLHFMPGDSGLKVYMRFDLHTPEHPTMRSEESFGGPGAIVGPSTDIGAQQQAVQHLMAQKLGFSCWHGRTGTPYR